MNNDVSTPNESVKALYQFLNTSLAHASLSDQERSALISVFNLLFSIAPNDLLVRILKGIVDLLTTPLSKRIKSLENEIETLKKKHATDIENHLASLTAISTESTNALKKVGTESINVIKQKKKIVTSMPEDEIAELYNAIFRAVEIQKKSVQSRIQTFQENAHTAKKNVMQDTITELPDQNAFAEYLVAAVNDCMTRNVHLTLMFLDIDGFRKFNENYDHSIGDKALNLVAQEGIRKLINANMAESLSFCTRYTNDKFAVVLKEQDLIQSKRIAELIRMKSKKLKRLLEEQAGIPIYTSIRLSIGVAEMLASQPQTNQRIQQLIEHANAALKKAKKDGGDKVITSADLMSSTAKKRVT